MEPIYGEFVELIHPYDFYVLIEKLDSMPDKIGETGIPIKTPEGWYLSQASIFKINDKYYVETTTVTPITDMFNGFK